MGRAAAVTGRADGRGFKLVLGGKVGAALRPVSDRLDGIGRLIADIVLPSRAVLDQRTRVSRRRRRRRLRRGRCPGRRGAHHCRRRRGVL